MKDGIEALPDTEGARKFGMTRICTIDYGETKTFKVSAGRHDLAVNDDIYGSNEITVEVLPQQTVKLVCGYRFDGIRRTYYAVKYMFSRTIPGKNFYYIKKMAD